MAIRVERRGNEPIEKMLRRFKKRCEKEGLIKDLKKNEYYESPSERRRRDKRRLLKRLEKERQQNN